MVLNPWAICPLAVDDNLVPEELNNRLLEKYYSSDTKFHFYWSSTASKQFFHWHIEILNTPSYQLDDASAVLDQGYYNDERELWNLIQKEVGDSELLRCYVNGYTFGTEGFPHVDSDHEGEVTAMLYLAPPKWKPAWGGETNVFDKNGDVIKSFMPKRGRVVFFPSHYLHVGRSVSKAFNGIRTVLVYKFRPKSNLVPEIVKLKRALIRFDTPKVEYGQTTLFKHLSKCYTLLKDWGATDDVCKAGMFHNVLGTAYFDPQLKCNQYDLIGVIGENAANLVALYSAYTHDPDLRMSVKEFADINLIGKANAQIYGGR